ncbi:MAG: pyridoxal phosphate-dependent aminotransferase [Fimbriimonadaceae bacterium]|nr:pyridoxal phosphate-dependent aminotransferase [Fimbriimonadaceae bacterium]
MNTPRLSARAGHLQPSPTLAITAKAKAMRAAGEDVISLAAGEPDFDTPPPIVEACIAALRAGFTRYTPTPGIPELREAVAAKLKRENGVAVEPAQVVVSSGAKQCLFNALMATVGPGDEVLLLAPYWPTYADQVVLAGATPVVVRTRLENGFVPDPEEIRAAVTPKTRAIMLNSPCNPTGAVYDRAVLKAIAQIALRHDLWILSDEIYEKLVYEGEHVSIASLGQDVADRTVTINGCSKSYAMTGWRVGYCAGPKALASTMAAIQDQVTSNANSFAQKGALQALQMPEDAVAAMRDEFRRRRDLVLVQLRAIEGARVFTPPGAFYAFVDIGSVLGPRCTDDLALAETLLCTYRVATVPGTVFHAPGHLRLSYAASLDDLNRGVARIAEGLLALRS